jgi:hypothetical protein
MAKAQTLPSLYPDLEDDDQDLPLVPQSAQAPQSLTSLLPTVGVPTDSKLPASLNGNGISVLPSLSSVAADKDQQSAVGQVMDQSKPAGALPGPGADVPAMDPNTGDYTRIQHLNTILPTADESLGKGPMSVLPPVSQPTVTSRQEQMAENQEDRLERDQNRLDQLNTPWDKSAHGFFGNLGHALGQSTAGTRAGNAARLAGAEDAVKNDATVLDQMRATQDAQKKTDYAQTNYQQGQAGRDAETNEKNAQAHLAMNPQPKPGQEPISASRVPGVNQLLANRWTAFPKNAGKAVPPEYQLPENPTKEDYDRVSTALAGLETTEGTAQQREQAQQNLEQGRAIMAQNHADSLGLLRDRMLQSEQDKGRSAIVKAAGAYHAALQSADTFNGLIQQAKAGNAVSANVLPLEGALDITTTAGTKRINRTEVDQVAGAGSLYDKIAGRLAGWTRGVPYDQSLINDMAKLSGMLERGAYKKYRADFDTAQKTYGTTETPEDDPNGPKVGDVKKLKSGQTVKITAVHPDGTYDAK